ncbi:MULTISPECIES: protoglobin domain-containing protein [Acidithiobacillus]|uniref:protoglobin domain-containing protein n=1 Tax=Acidithiobacillus TaxID=119977 RepID=UPI00094AF6C6|nr:MULTISPECIES: protoglobin domain-containing protein [Acidithiobacillus]MBE7563663.1 hypothetical protein [Acidithiobacillus sp. HP-6]MBE7569458.1 hypothetical protein [Acidithiobacillus sp. HP-2]
MKYPQQTLLEKIKINDSEILNRMNLLSLGKEDFDLSLRNKAAIEDDVDTIVDEFYKKQTEFEEIAAIIGDHETAE